jgi:hypothetical protein
VLSIAGIDIITLKDWSQLMKWAGKNVSDDPDDIPTLASMLFGDDWEDEIAGLTALQRDVNYLVRNANGKIPGYLAALKNHLNSEMKIRQASKKKQKSVGTRNSRRKKYEKRKV